MRVVKMSMKSLSISEINGYEGTFAKDCPSGVFLMGWHEEEKRLLVELLTLIGRAVSTTAAGMSADPDLPK
jgi:hypothetical protein